MEEVAEARSGSRQQKAMEEQKEEAMEKVTKEVAKGCSRSREGGGGRGSDVRKEAEEGHGREEDGERDDRVGDRRSQKKVVNKGRWRDWKVAEAKGGRVQWLKEVMEWCGGEMQG